MNLRHKTILSACSLLLTLSQISLAEVTTTAYSGTTTSVEVSNVNPNRFHCVNGQINDVHVPGHIAVDPSISAGNVFIGYKLLKKGGTTQYVSEKHTIHITCEGEVYSILATPVNSAEAAYIQLGDPNKDRVETNAKLLREKSIEDLGIYLIKSAYNNTLHSNITVSTTAREYRGVVDWVTINEVRQLKLEGAGLTLREFILRATPGKRVQGEMFINEKLSDKIFQIATHPQVADSKGYARLFIVEKFL